MLRTSKFQLLPSSHYLFVQQPEFHRSRSSRGRVRLTVQSTLHHSTTSQSQHTSSHPQPTTIEASADKQQAEFVVCSVLFHSMSASTLSFLITGASSGVGFETASALAAAGKHIIITARTQDKVDSTLQRLRAAHSTLTLTLSGYPLELTDFTSIESLAATLSALPSLKIHCLICNAGSNHRGECHGLQLLWINNYLGHYHLTRLLLPLLQRTSRTTGHDSIVIQVASVMHRMTSADSMLADAIRSEKRPRAYSHSKLAQVMFAFELQRRYGTRRQPNGRVAAVAVNPGAVNSDIWRHISKPLTYITAPLFRLLFLTSAQGALTSLYAATASPPPEGRLDYLTPYWAIDRWTWLNTICDVWAPWCLIAPTKSEANDDAYDEAKCRELWELSELQCRSISGKDCYK